MIGRWYAALSAILGVVAALAGPAAGQSIGVSETPRLYVNVLPEGVEADRGYVQGQLILTAQIVSKYPFEELSLDLPTIADADVYALVRPRTRRVRSYGGDGYVLAKVIAIFPRKSGVLTIPSVRAAGMIEPEPDDERRFDETSAPIEIAIAPAQSALESDWWLVAERVEISETWSAPVETWRVDDIVRREVTVSAFGTTADRLPSLSLRPAQGTNAVDAGSERRTELTSDGAVAHLTQRWDVEIVGQPLAYVGPIRLPFWNAASGGPDLASLPGVRAEPLPPDSQAIAERLMAEAQAQHDGRLALAAAVAALLALPLLAGAAALAWAAWPTAADRALQAALAGTSDSHTAYRAIDRWARATDGSRVAELRNAIDGPARDGIAAIQAALFASHSGTSPPVETTALAKHLVGAARAARVRAMARRIGSAIDGHLLGSGRPQARTTAR